MKGTCKICGCTENNACYHINFGACWWVDDTQELCSHCSIEEINNSSGVQGPISKSMKETKNDYIRLCLSMTPEERFWKGIELSEWAMMTNKYHDEEMKKLLSNNYLLT